MFSTTEEKEIAYYGLSISDIQELVFEFAEMNDIPHPFNTEKKRKRFCLWVLKTE